MKEQEEQEKKYKWRKEDSRGKGSARCGLRGVSGDVLREKPFASH